MDSSVKIIVYRSTIIFDSVIVTFDAVNTYDPKLVTRDNEQDKEDTNSTTHKEHGKVSFVRFNRSGCNAYLASAYIYTMRISDVYRTAALTKLMQLLNYKSTGEKDIGMILMKLRMPRKQFLDYKWNDRMTQMVLERRELDHAMSWLSTLGGAFSALGDEFEHCAEVAGKISVKQFELALRLGDDLLVARCKLYAALSLIQRGQLSIPKKIVQDIYKLAVAKHDTRLQNMCQGIWAKLKYTYKIRRAKKKGL